MGQRERQASKFAGRALRALWAPRDDRFQNFPT